MTYTIYHIVGRKVGCTKDMNWRKKLYQEMEGKVPKIEVLEELPDEVGDQVAGDREWWWADRFGYKRKNHYTVIMNAVKERSKKGASLGGRRSMEKMTLEQRSEKARKAGRRSMEKMTLEQRSEKSRKSGRRRMGMMTPQQLSEFSRKGGQKTVELGLSGFQQRGRCSHCGFEGSLAILALRHNDNCKNRRFRFVRGN